MLSLREFAKIAGTSPATVSRTFAGNTNVASKTRERLFKLAEKCNFRPSAVRSAVIGGKTKSVGVVIHNLNVSYFADIAVGIQEALIKYDHLAIIVNNGIETEISLVDRLIDHRVDGLILNLGDETLTRNDFKNVSQLDIPIVVLETNTAGLAADVVESDDIDGSSQATEHLVKLGHQRIGFCYYGEGINCTCDPRFSGFKQVLEKYNLELNEHDIAILPAREKNPENHLLNDLRRILSAKSRPTAFFAPTDFIALNIFTVAKELNIKIPDDLSVVGYADLNFASYVNPNLTTVRQNGYLIGKTAAEMMMKRLTSSSQEEFQKSTIPVELIVRESTCKSGGKCN